MSKQSDNVMLVPGEAGWEIWSGSPGGQLSLVSRSDSTRAAEISGIPNGNLILLFPVRSFTALPLRVPTDDAALIPEMAAMHAERQGLRPDPMAGQLTDEFFIEKASDGSAFLSVVLKTPGEGEMPSRTPGEFDLSARAIDYSGDSIVLWKEFNRWVFAISSAGRLLYVQATALVQDEPDAALAREVKLALMQLSMQGFSCNPNQLVIYSSVLGSALEAEAAFGMSARLLPKPPPVLPEPRSKLLPDDVRAARKVAQRRQQTTALLTLVAIVYVAALGWFGYTYWQGSKSIKTLKAKAEAVAPGIDEYQNHVAKWDELAPVVDINLSPVEILHRISREMPKTGNIRLESAIINLGEVKLEGGAEQFASIKQFDLALRGSSLLQGYKWSNQEPAQNNKGWKLGFSGFPPGSPEANR